jgi:peptidoglycan/LPS O-acetylase OafA/YrhL
MDLHGSPERSAWRWPAAAAALVAVAAHIPITPTHLREAPYIGWSFIALELTLTILAAALILRDSPPVWSAAGVVPALAMLAYALTRTMALPQIGDDLGNWTQPLGLVALTAETLLILITLGRNAKHHPANWLTQRPVLWAGLLLVAGLVATNYAVAVGGTG